MTLSGTVLALQITSGTSGAVIDTAARIVGTAILAGFLAAAVALLYRWYVRERVPAGLALLVGLAGVALVAGTTSLLAQELTPGADGPDALAALLNVVTFLVGGTGAYAGMRAGDALGVDLFAAAGGDAIEGEVSELVKAVGRVISVDVPDDIDDIVGYDPVPEATKEKLAGRTFFFPRRLTRAELRERFVSRLKTDYGVGHVDVEFDESGGIEYLALGSRAAGIGPTLPPATNAVAIRADPAHAASAGDLVQVWETDPLQRVLTGELRGVAGEVVTVAIDAGDTPKLDPTTEYKLVTLPVQDRPDREFASLLRAADETLATITVQPGSRADGMSVADLGVTVAAVTREDEPPTPLPARDRRLRGGDVLYAIATPDALRKLEGATEAADGVVAASDASEGTDDAGIGEASTGTDQSAPAGDETTPAAVETDDPVSTEADATEGGAFPDSDDLPGIDPEAAMAESTGGWDDEGGEEQDGAPNDESESESPNDADEATADRDDATPDESIPDSAAFPDTDDLPGIGDDSADDDSGADGDVDDANDSDGGDDGEPAEDETGEGDVDESDDASETTGDFADLLDEATATDEDLDDGLDDLLDDEDDADADTGETTGTDDADRSS